jgi:hypothetical protein
MARYFNQIVNSVISAQCLGQNGFLTRAYHIYVVKIRMSDVLRQAQAVTDHVIERRDIIDDLRAPRTMSVRGVMATKADR